MRRVILIWVAVSILALLGACSPAQIAKGVLSTGGPKVAANVQAGKTNAQVLGRAQLTDQRLVRPQARTIEQSAGETGVRAEAVQSVTVRNEAPPWVWVVAILAVGLAAASLTDELRDWLARRRKKGAANADQ